MEKIIVSACLLGDKCRYDGHSNYHPLIKELREKADIIPVCPEVNGGLGIPRRPSEIRGNKVVNEKGKDITKYFDKGVDYVENVVNYLGVEIAVLKEKSPSCGVKKIYDGSFSHKLIDGQGWLTRRLTELGVRVYSEEDLEELLKEL